MSRAGLARAILIGGSLGAVLMVGRSVPLDNRLRFHLPKLQQPACRLDFDWTAVDDEAHVGGASIVLPGNRFAIAESTIRAPSGQYRLTVAVMSPRREGSCYSELAAHPMQDLTIRLEGGEANIHLSPAEIP